MENNEPIDDLLKLYLQSLSEKDLQGYEIAMSHLGNSFDLSKSLGFIEWKKSRKS
jgi:hypothetical protein